MKKTITLALALFAMIFASCKKDYTCVCLKTQVGVAAQTYKFTIEHESQKNADNACGAKSYKDSLVDYSCSIE